MWNLRQDWITHLKGGSLVLLANTALALPMHFLGAHWLTIVLTAAGFSAGGSVEGAQKAVNRAAIARGVAPPHDVSVMDMLMSAALCWLAAIAVQLAAVLRWI